MMHTYVSTYQGIIKLLKSDTCSYLPTTVNVELLERDNPMPHRYTVPLSSTVTFLRVTVLLIYAGVVVSSPVRLPVTYIMLIVILSFLIHAGTTAAPIDIKYTHVNVAVSPSHTVVSTGSTTT